MEKNQADLYEMTKGRFQLLITHNLYLITF